MDDAATPPTNDTPPAEAPAKGGCFGFLIKITLGLIFLFVIGAMLTPDDDEDSASSRTPATVLRPTPQTRPPLPAPPPGPRGPTVDQAGDCPPFNPATFDLVEAFLDPGLYLGFATSDTGPSGVEWFVATIFRDSDDEVVSFVDTWVGDGGTVFAISGSAREYSSAPNGRDIYTEAFTEPIHRDLQDCATIAYQSR